MGMWDAASDLDYEDEIHRYDEPKTTKDTPYDVRLCLRCRSHSAHWHPVPGGQWCHGCFYSKADRRRKGAAA